MNRDQWALVPHAIFFTSISQGWQKGWMILFDDNGNPFTDMELAKQWVRNNMNHKQIGLADFEQMKLNNAV